MTEKTQEEINEATGFKPDEDVRKDDILIKDEPKDIPKEDPKSKEDSKPEDKVEDKKEPKVEDPKKEDPKPSEEDDKGKSKEDPKPVERKVRTVPYGKLKQEREKREDLEKDIPNQVAKGVTDAFKQLFKSQKAEDLPDPIRKAAEEIAKEEDLDAGGIEKILKKAKELSGDNELPKEITDALEELKTLKAGQEESKKKESDREDKENFNTEWEGIETKIKVQYPNASDEMIIEAKEKMDEFAHSNLHHTHKMDYILFNEKETFDTMLKVASGSSSGEKGKDIIKKIETEEEHDLPKTEDITPEMMKERESRDLSNSDGDIEDMIIIEPIED